MLREAARRVKVRRGILAVTPGAISGGVVALLWIAAAKTTWVPLWSAWLAPLAVLGGTGIAFLIAWSRPISNEEIALLFDLRYGLAERISTGWEIAQKGPRTEVELRAVDVAIAAARRADPKDAVPVRPPKSAPVSLASFVLPLLLALLLPSWIPSMLSNARTEQNQVKQAGQQLQQAANQLGTPTPTPTPGAGQTAKTNPVAQATPNPADPASKMKKLAQKMSDGKVDKRDAMKELSELDKQIAKAQAQQSKSDANRALARAADEMEQKEAEKGLGKAMSDGDADEIKKEEAELEKKFDKGGFEKHQEQQLADDLDKIADALEQGGDQASANELREASKDLRKGDLQGAKDHLQKADLSTSVAAAQENDPVHKMAQELQQNADTHEAGKAMDSGSEKKAADQFNQLADKLEKGELTAEQKQELQKTLENAAKQGQSQGQDTPGGQMSQPIAKAAQSMKAGNDDGAAEALRNLAQGMQNGSQTAKNNAEARTALAQAQQKLQGQGQQGKGQGQGQGQDGQGGQGVQKMPWGQQGDGQGQQGDGQGQGQGQQGQGQGKGRPGSQQVASGSGQAGTQAGTGTSKFQDQGYDANAGGPQYDRQSAKTGDWKKEYEQAYKAMRTNQAKLSDTQVKGQLTQGDSQFTTKDGKPPDKGSAHDGYVSLPDDYRDAAEEAVGDEDIPPEHRDRVKAYFESISGNATPAPAATAAPH